MISRHSAFATLLAGTALLAGCTTPANLNNTDNSKRNTGALMGAAVGGLVGGPISGGDGKRAVAGAAIGAAVGGIIGSNLDKQAAELQQQLGNGVTVSNQGDQLLVSFPQDILFATDSTTIPSSQRSELNALAANLLRYPTTNVEIIGHTDNTGAAAYNFDLSTRRAGAVASILVAQGVPGGRVTAIGRGEDAPIATNLTPEGRAQNRRVEVIIRPQT
ncbi:OmpA family protein [Pseudoruegeria sp. SK021]|uniref:OmpA family protein n=1 Tax=Pseudoruegeria sp. SK021 TaxID=1933035 RepID=UPI000A23B21C|nr:OmpA family protein [Pseudoruegeria sp. SK021]OSP56580.1 hypothetical protein BV911_01060 [Pseudoruegeria sp. SK021]